MIAVDGSQVTFIKAFESEIVHMWLTFLHYQSHRRGHSLPNMPHRFRTHARIIWRQLNWFMNHMGSKRYQAP
jgi:hypothetical protein